MTAATVHEHEQPELGDAADALRQLVRLGLDVSSAVRAVAMRAGQPLFPLDEAHACAGCGLPLVEHALKGWTPREIKRLLFADWLASTGRIGS